MENYILFSAVGGHDPIANFHDGAVLHICRNYKPQKVYLFLSKEMTQRSDMDNRYVYSLERLQKHLGFEIEHIELIKKENLTEVQLFDTFYQEFETIIEKIISENPESTVLLNLSSGTPAMKSAMEIISTLSTENIKAIQVSTPVKKENFKTELPENYDNNFYWETNEDNDLNYTNRCCEINSVNLNAKIKKEILIELIKNYDYHAANVLAKSIKKFLNPRAINMIRAALMRSQLDIEGYNQIAKQNGFDFLPIKNAEIQPAFEYALVLEIKCKQRQYADFVRAISPVILDIFAVYLKKSCGLDFKKNYCKPNYKGVYYPNVVSMEKDEKGRRVKKCLVNAYNLQDDPGKMEQYFYCSSQMFYLIKEFSDSEEVKDAAEKLRNVEQNIRNITAHEIISVNANTIKERAGIDAVQIVHCIRLIIEKSIYNMENEYWNSYNDMNKQIIKIILE